MADEDFQRQVLIAIAEIKGEIARMRNDQAYTNKNIDSINKRLDGIESNYVPVSRFQPIERGLWIVLTGVAGAIVVAVMNLVLNAP